MFFSHLHASFKYSTWFIGAVVLIFTLISRFLSLFPKFLESVPITPTAIGITVNFMFHKLFSFLARSMNFPSVSPSSISILWFTGTAKITKWQVLSFLVIYTKFDLLVQIGWSVGISKFWEFFRLIFKERLCFVHIPFVSETEFYCLAQFLVEFPSIHAYSIIILIIRVFQTIFSWWYFTGVWVTANLFRYPGFSSVI